jgi:hypothetical protein
MLWQRAFSCAFLFHAAVLCLCVFTVRVPPGMYRAEVFFLGPVLRFEEVSAGKMAWRAPVDTSEVGLVSDLGLRPRAWHQGVGLDKPDLFKNTPVLEDDRILRFSGERVELDQPVGLAIEDESPALAPLKLHLDRP